MGVVRLGHGIRTSSKGASKKQKKKPEVPLPEFREKRYGKYTCTAFIEGEKYSKPSRHGEKRESSLAAINGISLEDRTAEVEAPTSDSNIATVISDK